MIYRTKHPEQALQALALRYPHVVLRRVYHNQPFIPLRMRMVKGVDWYFYSRGYPTVARQQLQAWQAGRGILVNTFQTADKNHPIGPHDALLLAECPTSLYRIEAESRDTRHCTVIYEPPSWRHHEETIARTCPTVEHCRAAYNWMKEHPGPVADSVFCKDTGIRTPLNAIRFLLYKWGALRPSPLLIPIRLLYRPDEPDQAVLYDWLGQYPIKTINGYRYVPEPELIAHNHRWRQVFKMLRRANAVEKEELLHCYEFRPGIIPNWEMMGRQYRMLRGEFESVRQLVAAAPVYPHREILSGYVACESL